tara:strand:+ start:2232 stop:2639 length:408 start_codon:yes stop_codon:yes gene_type:complete
MFSSSGLFNQEKNKNVLREYQIVDFPNKNKNFGGFKGTYPKQAAEKAFTFLSNIVGDEVKKDGNFIVFSIQQKSKNTNNMNKELKFIGTVIKLENDVFNKEQNKMIKYKNILSKYNPDLDNIKAKNKKINYKSKN